MGNWYGKMYEKANEWLDRKSNQEKKEQTVISRRRFVLYVIMTAGLGLLMALACRCWLLNYAADDLSPFPWATIAAVAAVPTLLLTWYWRTRHKQTDIRVTQEGQITERFTRAIGLLGNDRREVRLGAIYALERIARDSTEDHWTIMETLAAFVRNNASIWASKDLGKVLDPLDSGDKIVVQAALTVIRRRRNDVDEKGRVDLSYSNLRETDLSGLHAESANFDGACMYKTKLSDARAPKATFIESTLQEADLGRAVLDGSYFSNAKLHETIFLWASLRDTTFNGAVLSKADLRYADLQGAILQDADLEGAQLQWANLRGVNLHAKNISGADFHRAFYDDVTSFDANFDPKRHEMLEVLKGEEVPTDPNEREQFADKLWRRWCLETDGKGSSLKENPK